MNDIKQNRDSIKYHEAAVESHKNSLNLLDESELLFNSSRYARSYALAVLSLEEFAKSFLYRCVSVGIITDQEFPKDLRKHEEKLFHAAHIITASVVLTKMVKSKHEWNQDKKESDHTKHKFPTTLDQIIKDSMSDINYIVDLLRNANEIKKKAFYVETKESLVVPDKIINQEKCQEILKIIRTVIPGFDYVLKLDDKQFTDFVGWLDPQIFSGTIKSE